MFLSYYKYFKSFKQKWEKNIILKLKYGNYDITKIKKFYEKYISKNNLKNVSVEI